MSFKILTSSLLGSSSPINKHYIIFIMYFRFIIYMFVLSQLSEKISNEIPYVYVTVGANYYNMVLEAIRIVIFAYRLYGVS